jgi:hypothetical protein
MAKVILQFFLLSENFTNLERQAASGKRQAASGITISH